MKKILIIVALLSSVILAFKGQNKHGYLLPKHFPKPNYNFEKNPLTPEKIYLGRVLFYDNILSKNNSISCANCHSSYNAFAHTDHALSHGIYDSIGTRNASALMNLAWQRSFMWDGAVNHLDMQALAPIHSKIEMDERIENVVEKLQASEAYRKLYTAAYNDSVVTGEHTLKAISSFMLTLISANSKYDRVKNGVTSFNSQEKNGYTLFIKNCNSCHIEPLFTNHTFENNGLKIDAVLYDIGRMSITKNNNDSLKFKVPTLRNIEYTYPYMHDGRFKTLNEVLNHYTNNILASTTLAPQLRHSIQLSSNEKVDLISFLVTLTDKEFLFNQKHAYPREQLNK